MASQMLITIGSQPAFVPKEEQRKKSPGMLKMMLAQMSTGNALANEFEGAARDNRGAKRCAGPHHFS